MGTEARIGRRAGRGLAKSAPGRGSRYSEGQEFVVALSSTTGRDYDDDYSFD